MERHGATDPTEHLGREHAELLHVFRLLEGIVGDVEAGRAVPRERLALVVDYLILFGDLRHHDKEESLLVPVLVWHGFDWFEGPLARMRRDHRQERYLIRVLAELADRDRPWSSEDSRRLVGTGREFIAFMRAHLKLENEEILAPARTRLSPEAQAHLLSAFEHFDEEHERATDYVALRARLEPLLAEHAEDPGSPRHGHDR